MKEGKERIEWECEMRVKGAEYIGGEGKGGKGRNVLPHSVIIGSQ